MEEKQPTIATVRPARPALIGTRVRALLALHGLSQAAAARALGVSSLTLGRTLSGRRPAPAALVGKLRAFLGPRGWRFATGRTCGFRVSAEVR